MHFNLQGVQRNMGISCNVQDFDEEELFQFMSQHYWHFNACRTYKWTSELNSLCCEAGKVRLEPVPDPPTNMKKLFNVNECEHFLNQTKACNDALALASLGCNEVVVEPGYSPTFKIQGQLYHRKGSLLPIT